MAEQNPEKCIVDGCILSKTNLGTPFCYFHEPTHRDGHHNRNSLLEYLNDNAENIGVFVGTEDHPRLLLLQDLRIHELFLKSLTNNIERPIRFLNCEFGSQRLFNSNLFRAYVEFQSDKAHDYPFYKCQFEGGVRITGEASSVVFNRCQIYEICDLNISKKFNPKIDNSIRYCTIEGQGRCKVKSSYDMRIEEVTANVDVEIDSQQCSIYIENSNFKGYTTIYAPDDATILLNEICIVGDLLLKGTGQNTTVPRMILNRIDCFKDAVVMFKNLSLAKYDFVKSDFTFDQSRFLHTWFGLPIGKYHDTYKIAKALIKVNSNQKDILDRLVRSYRSLQLYYDGTRDYTSGNAFHSAGLRAKWKRYRLINDNKSIYLFLNWHTWYFLISDFGQSWFRPLIWIICISIVACIAYSLIGIYPIGQWNEIHNTWPYRINNGLTYAFQKFAFWFRTPGARTLVPFNWIGWVVAFLQTSITLVAGTFFILALRRRFKR